jgi:nitric oxide reductase NorF protein
MSTRRLIRAWLLLSILTAFGTAVHLGALPDALTGALILCAAMLKTRLIVLDYLELRGVEGWAGGVQAILAALLALVLVLYLAALSASI